MIDTPAELRAHVKGSRLEVTGGTFTDLTAMEHFLQAQQHLTHIAISEDASLPQHADGISGAKVLALAADRSHSPNLLDVSIAGGNYQQSLRALCSDNYRRAADLLERAKDRSYVLKKEDCSNVALRLPAMLSIASARGATSGTHNMPTHELVATLERIRDHAAQYQIDTGVDAPIERLCPKSVIISGVRTSELLVRESPIQPAK